ncbi:hypothetical protein [Marinifilum fragile]|uniref:hypothetical protein n=1 Tax=Marinifilum fragile TaxID=570161 RepID=UPI002AA676D1|nr:hypothetical protein [Marinifilum fragile]
MNKEYILYNLKEALEQLSNTIHELETDKDYEYGNFRVDMEHLYHHVNTAWNAQNSSDQESRECSESNYNTWRQFPKDMDWI